MIKKFALIFCLTFFVCSFSDVLAETNKNDILQEGEAYKMLYEDTKNANAKILDNVYFALTFAGGFILLFLGSNAFFSFRSRKSEAEALKNENAAEILKIKNDLRKEMNDNFNILKEEYQKALEEKVNEKFEELKKEKQNLERSLQNAERKIAGFEYSLTLVKAEFAFEKGDYHRALDLYMLDARYLWETSIQDEDDPFIDTTLVRSLEKVNEVLLKTQSIGLEKHNRLSNFLDELPQRYSIVVQTIKDTLNGLEKTAY
ncbi:hypothetical protein [uncultured Metabacillus sp.]|uniref:hypothetical protein n=1 Tax=uncultured Metabacillus sp. TaxID=2860135 RepID=UPI00263857A7|nr:hypothetical protein [uncultured Metabacillus sp.]